MDSGQNSNLRQFGEDSLDKMLVRQKRYRRDLTKDKAREATKQSFDNVIKEFQTSQSEIAKIQSGIQKRSEENFKLLIQHAKEIKESVINETRDLNARIISVINFTSRTTSLEIQAKIAELIKDSIEKSKLLAIEKRNYYEATAKGQHEIAARIIRNTSLLQTQINTNTVFLRDYITTRADQIIGQITQVNALIDSALQTIAEIRTQIQTMKTDLQTQIEEVRNDLIARIGAFNDRLNKTEADIASITQILTNHNTIFRSLGAGSVGAAGVGGVGTGLGGAGIGYANPYASMLAASGIPPPASWY